MKAAVTTLSGALRYIDETAVGRGLAAVKLRKAVSLGMPITQGGGPISPLRPPMQHFMQERAWPGLGADCIAWIKEKRIAILGADNMAVEAVPSGVPGTALPLHVALLRGEGVLFIELLDLEAVAGRTFEAMLTLNPLRIVGGTASPVAPMLLM